MVTNFSFPMGPFQKLGRTLPHTQVLKFSSVISVHIYPVHAKPCLSQVNVSQKLYATGKYFGFTCHNDKSLLSNIALYLMV